MLPEEIEGGSKTELVRPRSDLNVVGTKVLIKCNQGPILEVTLSCFENGSWSSEVPTCAKGVICFNILIQCVF